MRVFFFIALLYFSAGVCTAQADQKQIPLQKEEILICRIMEKAAYTNTESWKTWLAKKMDPDSLYLDSLAAGTYCIRANILIDTSGLLKVIQVIDDPGYGIGDHLKRVIETYPLRWTAAEHNGRKVKGYRQQPVIIQIEEEEECGNGQPALMLSPE